MSAQLPEGFVREHPDGCTLSVRVQPGAKRTAITGVYGEGEQAALRIALQAPPIDGRANEALIGYVAELFDLPRAAVTLTHGQTGRSKRLLLSGLQASDARRRLESLL
jgi:uncharacterized protein (TIGR00251 family)